MILESINDRIRYFDGRIGICYTDITRGITYEAGNCDVFRASGLVKLAVLIESFRRIEEGTLDRNDRYIIKKDDYIDPVRQGNKTFGALEYLHLGTELTIEDLYKLCIAVSDNMAFNILFKMYGKDSINDTLAALGCRRTRVNRAIMDEKGISKGIENYVSVKEMSNILYRMYRGQIISRKASRQMLDIMKAHQKASIIPYCLNEKIQISHQSGYDDDVIMDMGIVHTPQPFVLCMAAADTNIRNAESVMRDVTIMCLGDSSSSRNLD